MPQVLDPKKLYVSIAAAGAALVFAGGAIWWAAAASAKLDYTADAVKPIPQMQQDIALIKQAVQYGRGPITYRETYSESR